VWGGGEDGKESNSVDSTLMVSPPYCHNTFHPAGIITVHLIPQHFNLNSI
jgi:hypothetical protein